MFWLSVLYLVSLYAIQAALVVPLFHGGELMFPLFWLALGANAVLGAAVLWSLAAGLGRTRENPARQRLLNRLALGMKLAVLPFYYFHLVIWIFVSTAFLVVPGLQVFLLSGLLGVAFAWGVLAVTSAYSISGLYIRWRRGTLSTGKFVRDVALLLIFVLDTVSALVFFFQMRKESTPKAGVD